MFKKIVVTEYKPTGDMWTQSVLTLRKPIHANDYKQAKKLVKEVLLKHVGGRKRFTVEWKRDGFSEGFMVH